MIDPCTLTRDHLMEAQEHAIDETLRKGREHGFLVFIEDGVIKRTGLKTGNRTSIFLNPPSVLGLGIFHTGETIGAFHTHPNLPLDELLSVTDIRSMFRSGIEFSAIGYLEDGRKRVAVFDRHGFDSFDDFRVHMAATVFSGHNTVTELQFARQANKMLLRCQFEVGSVPAGLDRRCETCV